MGVQIGIVALGVGWMVGKAIRAGSYGIGGRPQQLLAVGLTYFAISTSFIPASFFLGAKQAYGAKKATKGQRASPLIQDETTTTTETISTGKAIAGLLVFSVISPFLELRTSPAGGLISLFILFVGLQRAWAMTARHEIIVTGPYT